MPDQFHFNLDAEHQHRDQNYDRGLRQNDWDLQDKLDEKGLQPVHPGDAGAGNPVFLKGLNVENAASEVRDVVCQSEGDK